MCWRAEIATNWKPGRQGESRTELIQRPGGRHADAPTHDLHNRRFTADRQ